VVVTISSRKPPEMNLLDLYSPERIRELAFEADPDAVIEGLPD
jgi:hypothetical protein